MLTIIDKLIIVLPLLIGWCLDLVLGDPSKLPHPIVWFGKAISFFEHRYNRGNRRMAKGAVCSIILILAVYFVSAFLLNYINIIYVKLCIEAVAIFYCLAGTTLIREVKDVFHAADESLEKARKQIARIVGRDTKTLSLQEIRTAALETLAENLSDGVIAPLFWYALLGVPGMLAYKMVNTLDSMIGYRTERFAEFGCVAARIDDIANYIPSRLTAFLMIAASGKFSLFNFVRQQGCKHLSPNSGYPEAALAGILNCRFGGPHNYFGITVEKPFIGTNNREITTVDMSTAVTINRKAEVAAVVFVCLFYLCKTFCEL